MELLMNIECDDPGLASFFRENQGMPLELGIEGVQLACEGTDESQGIGYDILLFVLCIPFEVSALLVADAISRLIWTRRTTEGDLRFVVQEVLDATADAAEGRRFVDGASKGRRFFHGSDPEDTIKELEDSINHFRGDRETKEL